MGSWRRLGVRNRNSLAGFSLRGQQGFVLFVRSELRLHRCAKIAIKATRSIEERARSPEVFRVNAWWRMSSPRW